MNERLIILLIVVAGVLLVGAGARFWARRRQRIVAATIVLPAESAGLTRIVTFYGPSCAACDRQKRVLGEMETELAGQVTIELRDATADYDYGRQFGLVIVPTTVVIQPNGRIAGINSGFVSRMILESQLQIA